LSREEANEFLIQAFYAEEIDAYRKVCASLTTLDIGPPRDLTQKVPFWTGLQICELILPDTLYLETVSLQIINGKILKGRLGADELQWIIAAVIQQFGDRVAADFISGAKLCFEWFLFFKGSTVSLEHCLNPCPEATKTTIAEKVRDVNHLMTVARDQNYLGTLPSFVEEAAITILDQGRAKTGDMILSCFKKEKTRHGPLEMVEGKAKGNEMNLVQISALLGQQIHGGRMMNSNSMYSASEKEFYNVETQGMVEHNFTEGLSPANYFAHSIGGRAGVVDTAVKTAENGYLTRKLDKATESLSTFADSTTRTANGSIVEWNFGDDNFNPQFVEQLPLRMIQLSQADFECAYQWSAITEEVKSVSTLFEFERLQKMRQEIRRIRQAQSPYNWLDTISSPVNLEMVFNKMDVCCQIQPGARPTPLRHVDTSNVADDYSRAFASADGDQGLLDRAYIVETVDQAVEFWLKSKILIIRYPELPFHSRWWSRTVLPVFPVAYSIPFLAYLYDWYSSKRILTERKWTRQELSKSLAITEKFLFRAKMGIFQQTGTIASQSVSEPTIQMTLTTFFNAGLEQKGAQDLRRMNEIINLLSTENMVFPSMQLPIDLDFCTVLQQEAQKVAEDLAKRMPAIILQDLVQDREQSVDILRHVPLEDEKLFQGYSFWFPEDVPSFTLASRESTSIDKHSSSNQSGRREEHLLSVEGEGEWMLRFSLQKNKCISRGLTPGIIALRILEGEFYATEDLTFVCSHPLEERWVIYLLFAPFSIEEVGIGAIRSKLWLLGERILSTLLIDGVRSIKSAKATEVGVVRENAEGKMEKSKEWIVETRGSDLGALWQFPEVNWRKASTNSIQDVSQEYGLEVAEITIAQQLEHLLFHNSKFVDRRHLALIAAIMTHYGTPLPLNRFGFIAKGPWERISFEESFPNLLHESLNARRDWLSGIIENIIVGNELPMGVNRFPKPINMNQTNESIQKALAKVEIQLETEQRHTERLWPAIPLELKTLCQEVVLKARKTRPSKEFVDQFFHARALEIQKPKAKESAHALKMLKFSSQVFDKWKFASYEYIFDELHLPLRHYSYQLHCLQEKSTSSSTTSLPMDEEKPKEKLNPSTTTLHPHLSLDSQRKLLPKWKPSGDSWSYLPRWKPSGEDYRHIQSTHPEQQTKDQKEDEKKEGITPPKKPHVNLLPLPTVFEPSQGEFSENVSSLLSFSPLKPKEDVSMAPIPGAQNFLTADYLALIPDYIGFIG
jgi:DNA-directed RNA polymerase II subunit RPB1